MDDDRIMCEAPPDAVTAADGAERRRPGRRALAQRYCELALLHELTGALGESAELEDALSGFLARLVQATGADVAALFQGGGDGLGLGGARLRAAVGIERERWGAARLPSTLVERLERDSLTGNPAVHPSGRDAGSDGWLAELFPWLTPPLERAAAVALEADGRLLGALVVAGRGDRPFPAWLPRVLARLARRTALALDHARARAALADARLARADRLASLGTLAAGMAHEINNPLTYVIGSLELIQEMLETGELARDPEGVAAEMLAAVGDALQGAARVRDIVRALRDFARPPHESGGPASVARAVGTAARMVRNEIRHRARLVCDAEGDVTADIAESALVQVALNLLLNAAHAITPGRADAHEIRVAWRRDPDGRARLTVRDTGEGMDAATVDRIFDPFFTTKRVGEGTGLGLSVCHGIVRSVGGEILVESAPGRGTELTVLLPAAEGPPAPAPTPTATKPRRRARILVVDDEPLVAETVRRALRDHDVTIATSGRAGLEAWLSAGGYDLAICDLMMPDLGGPQLYEAIRRRAPGSERRILFMTGGVFTPEVEAFVACLPRPPLEKPFDGRSLVSLVDALCARDETPTPLPG